jgi:hypothetical protein
MSSERKTVQDAVREQAVATAEIATSLQRIETLLEKLVMAIEDR